jgi:DNA-binding MarR family transcriptional regulator
MTEKNQAQTVNADTDGPGHLLNNIGFLVMEIGRLFRVNFDQRMRRLGLTRSEWWLLAHLWFFEGMTQQQLADLLDMTKGGLAKLIARLEGKGIIERRGETLGGRATKRIYFTTTGRTLGAKVDKGARHLVREAEAPLRGDQVEKLHELLRSVRQSLLPQDREDG